MLKNLSNVRTWYREIPVAAGVCEFFFTASFENSDEAGFREAVREIRERLDGLLFEGGSVTAFHPVSRPFSPFEAWELKKLARTAFIGWRGKDGRSFVFMGYLFENSDVRDSSFSRTDFPDSSVCELSLPDFRKTTLDAFSCEGEFESEVDAFYDRIESVMRSRSLPPESFVRSWNYVDSILKNYPSFNRVRDRRFDVMGIGRSACPAGTGIDAVLPNAGMSAFAEFHSAGESGAPKIVKYKAEPQCEALDYGPRFSRAAYVEAAWWRRIHISWTASVGPGGETLNADDIVANVAHTMETVRELLDIAGAEFSDVVRSHVYFKREEFEGAFSDWKARGGWDFPAAENVCDVCRDDWLFEFECVAFVRVKRGTFERFGDDAEAIGNKAENCRKLAELGFPVPPSLAIPGSALARDSRSPESGDFERRFESSLSRAFWEDFRQKRFAVRSSSSTEDSSSSSMAGAFRSEIDVPFSGLERAVFSVAESFGPSVEPFGILVQEYVPLSKFWVAFTCDPDFFQHAMVVEVSEGPGELLVSGKNVPKKFAFSRNSRIEPAVRNRIDFEFWRKTFRRIESAFFTPQDIEWGISETGEPFVFQSRPVTTLRSGEKEFLKVLDRFEVEQSSKGAFELVRNELCEPFDRPNTDELAFLRWLYAHESVVSAYRKWGIEYSPKDFLSVVGGRLFVDVRKERACFDFSDVPGFSGWWGRWKNYWNLGAVASKLRTRSDAVLDDLETRMLRVLESAIAHATGKVVPMGPISSDGRIPSWAEGLVSEWYPVVFETNFLASSWESARNGKVPVSKKAGYVPKSSSEWNAAFALLAKMRLSGNSLAFFDVSKFESPLLASERRKDWDSASDSAGRLPDGKNSNGRAVSGIPERLDFLREAGRCVSVLLSNALFPLETRSGGIRSGNGTEADIRCPRRLVSPFFTETLSGSGWETVSVWVAQGEFFVFRDFESKPFDSESGPKVFFVDSLDPALANSLPKSTVAVVSARGGRLSHFAIVARERGLPVFVSPGLPVSKFKGKEVKVSEEGIFEIL